VQSQAKALATAEIEIAKGDAAKANQQTEQLRIDLITETGKVATLQLDAANAEKDVARLQEDAANAKAGQQKVEIQLANAQVQVADANRQAEEARKTAEAEHLARLEMEKTLAPREIWLKTYEDGTTNVDDLKNKGRIKVLIEFIPDFEAARTAKNLDFLFAQSGWEVTLRPSSDFSTQDGVTIKRLILHGDSTDFRPEEKSGMLSFTLKAWLMSNDWETHEATIEQAELSENDIAIVVGLKPSPYFQPKQFKENNKREIDGLREFAPNANPDKPIKNLFFIDAGGRESSLPGSNR